MRKPYTSPSAFVVEFKLCETVMTGSGTSVGITDGSSVGDREVTNDDEANQFVKGSDVWDKEW